MDDLRDILRQCEFNFKKQWGQNFLTDPNLLRAIVSDAGVDEKTTVLEIGAGAGALTRALSERARKVFAYEIDRSLEPVLSRTLKDCNNVEVIFRDFAKADMSALETELNDYAVVANLPYYVTTPIVMRFVEESKHCRGLTVMVQEEVAERFCAREGTAECGDCPPRDLLDHAPRSEKYVHAASQRRFGGSENRFYGGRLYGQERKGLPRNGALRLFEPPQDAGK